MEQNYVRSIQRVVRLSPSESRIIDDASAQLAITPASYLRHLGINKKLPTIGRISRDSQREIWKQVSGMARNVNQIAIKANTLRLKPGELEDLKNSIDRLLLKIEALSK